MPESSSTRSLLPANAVEVVSRKANEQNGQRFPAIYSMISQSKKNRAFIVGGGKSKNISDLFVGAREFMEVVTRPV